MGSSVNQIPKLLHQPTVILFGQIAPHLPVPAVDQHRMIEDVLARWPGSAAAVQMYLSAPPDREAPLRPAHTLLIGQVLRTVLLVRL
jgi:hypothetical protein